MWHILTLNNVKNDVICGADRSEKLNRTRAVWTSAAHRKTDLFCQECVAGITPEHMNADDKLSPTRAAKAPRKPNMAAVRKVLKAAKREEYH